MKYYNVKFKLGDTWIWAVDAWRYGSDYKISFTTDHKGEAGEFTMEGAVIARRAITNLVPDAVVELERVS